MKRIAFIHIIPFLAALAVGFIVYQSLLNTDFINSSVKVDVQFDAEQPCEMQIFQEDDKQFSDDFKEKAKLNDPVKNYTLTFDLPVVKKPGRLRIDPGFTRGKWIFKKITLRGLSNNIKFDANSIYEKFKPAKDVKTYRLDNEGVYLESEGSDPNIISTFSLDDYMDDLNAKPFIYVLPFLLALCLAVFMFYIIRKKLSPLVDTEIKATHLFVLIFIFILVLPFLWMNLFPITSSSSGENRKLNEKPVFNFDKIMEYPKLFNHYFDDNFGFRKELSTLNSYYKLKIFQTSSKPDVVVVGKKSWLFSSDPAVITGYQNDKLFTDDELKIIRHNLEEAFDWHATKKADFFVIILPAKSNIYPEYLPECFQRKSGNSKLLQLRDYMEKNSGVKIIDVTNELLAAKKRVEVYYQHDFHWNFQGGYIGYEKLMGAINKGNPKLKANPINNYWTVYRHNHNADLSKILSLENILLNDEWHLEHPLKPLYKKVTPPEYESVVAIQPTVHSQIKNKKLPKAVVYRDSFFSLMYPFFADHFSDAIYIWTNELSVEVIEKEKPDIVVYEMLESSIDKLLEDNPVGMRK